MLCIGGEVPHHTLGMTLQLRRFQVKTWLALGLAVVTLGLYLPAGWHDFVQYDDQQYVTENPRVQSGLTWAGLHWAFGYHAGNWHPLAWLSHMLDCQLFGAHAGGHHLTSIFLHAASTALLFIVLNQWTGALWRSAAVAALFAWHPLHVESVAWVAERKDVLCAFFWMVTLLAYGRYAAESKVRSSRSKVYYGLSLLAFMLALMSKPMAVTLPFVLLLLDYWPWGRTQVATDGNRPAGAPTKLGQPEPPRNEAGRTGQTGPSNWWSRWPGLIWEKLPFFVLSAGACYLTMQAQQEAIVSTAGLPVSERLGHVAAAYGHYLAATFWPAGLGVYYPYEVALPAATLVGAGLVLGLITVIAISGWKSRPFVLVGWLWYLGTLVPVIGLVQVGDQAWADRYTYLPLIGVFLAVVWTAAELVRQRRVLMALGAATATGLLVLTTRQLSYWQDTHSLFEHTFQVTRDNYMAITVLGSQLAQAGKLEEAIADYQTALRLKPTFPEAHFFLGNAREQQGKLDEAVAEYQQALWFKPMQEQTHIFLGMVLGRQQQYDAAMAHYATALKLNPDSAVTHNNLARILHTLGRRTEAAEHYRAALAINPKLAIAHNNLGILLLQQGDVAAGAGELHQAWQLNATNSETQFNLALADNQLGQWAEAADLFGQTVRPSTTDPRGHAEYARALSHLGRTHEAMAQYAAALLWRADDADALAGLAWILATSPNPEFRNGTQALAMASRAGELTEHQDADKLKILAAALAETGDYPAAIQQIQAALGRAAKTGTRDGDLPKMLERFQHAQPWRTE